MSKTLDKELIQIKKRMKYLLPQITDWKLKELKDSVYTFYSNKHNTEYVSIPTPYEN